ncbi:MAG: helix-turn-helix domain-containing protein [Planctomycetaceae bacterium]|nr:helix-turn-helix domain-containing protein [Planctomycetaceae bacterium]
MFKQTQNPQGEKLAYSMREVSNLLGLSVRTVFSLTKKNELPHVRVGKRVLYPVDRLKAFLSQPTKPNKD